MQVARCKVCVPVSALSTAPWLHVASSATDLNNSLLEAHEWKKMVEGLTVQNYHRGKLSFKLRV
jgi:hypothetical protein